MVERKKTGRAKARKRVRYLVSNIVDSCLMRLGCFSTPGSSVRTPQTFYLVMLCVPLAALYFLYETLYSVHINTSK